MKKVMYLIAGTYRSGGMERVLANKANWLVMHGVAQVVIVTTDQRGHKPFFLLDPKIRRIDLDINYEENNGGSFMNKLLHYPLKQARHRRRLEQLLMAERPDVTISMFCNDASFLPRINDGSRKFIEIHFSRYKRLQYGRKGLWGLADRMRSRQDKRIVSRYDRFIVLTNEDRSYWEADSPMPNIRVISNARSFPPFRHDDVCHKTVLAVGRFCRQKALDRMIDAWALVRQSAVSDGWKLRIVGDGELRGELQRQISQLGLEESITLGRQEIDMLSVYGNADIYVMTSLYEGLPMVLLEAQAAGLPIVSMTCKCGPRDIVTDGVDGILVPEGDVDSVADAILRLIDDDELRQKMSKAALKASDRYAEEKIMEQWVKLIAEER